MHLFHSWACTNLKEKKFIKYGEKMTEDQSSRQYFNMILQDVIIPSAVLTVVEKLLTFRGRCLCPKYIPSYLERTQSTFSFICDSQKSYEQKLVFYKRKEPIQQKASKLGTTVTLKLFDSYKNSSRNITCANFSLYHNQ